MEAPSRAQQLGIDPGSTVWVLGHSDEENTILDPADDIEVIDDLDQVDGDGDDPLSEEDEIEPDAAIVVVDDAMSLADDLDEALPRVTGVDLVWVAVPLRSRGVDPDEVEAIVAEYGWRPSQRVELDESWVATRVTLV